MGKLKNYSLAFDASNLTIDDMFNLSDVLEDKLKKLKFKISGAGTTLVGRRIRDISFSRKEAMTTKEKNSLLNIVKKSNIELNIYDA